MVSTYTFLLVFGCFLVSHHQCKLHPGADDGAKSSAAAALEKEGKPNDKIVLNTLQDVEQLTYFLLWKHDFFDKLAHSSEGGEDQNTLTESKLRQFIEMLKLNNLINIHSEFNVSKKCDEETFRQLSTPKWWPTSSLNHSRDICEAANSCKNARQLFDLLKLPTPTLSQSISRLCPLMLFQLQEKECVQQRELNFKAQNRPSPGAVWGYGFLFVTIVSFCSLVGVGVLPFLSEKSYEIILNIFQGLGVGSLVGSAIFHLIPQAFNLVQPGTDHEYLWRALIIFSGIYLFFWSERIMKIISELRKQKKMKQIMSIPSSTSIDNDEAKLRQVCFSNSEQVTITRLNNGENGERVVNGVVGNGIDAAAGDDDDSDGGDNQIVSRNRADSNFLNLQRDVAEKDDDIPTIAWMIIVGDGLHNFIDGITIGAAFSQSILEGISISVAVICEEFPHELGDFAILLGSGMSMRKALGYNFLSACTCYIGFVFGILIGDLQNATPYVFALAGGMFLYISLVDIMGELSNKLEVAAKKSFTATSMLLFLQNVGIILGVGIMFSLARYSDKINFEGLVPPKNTDMPFTKT